VLSVAGAVLVAAGVLVILLVVCSVMRKKQPAPASSMAIAVRSRWPLCYAYVCSWLRLALTSLSPLDVCSERCTHEVSTVRAFRMLDQYAPFVSTPLRALLNLGARSLSGR